MSNTSLDEMQPRKGESDLERSFRLIREDDVEITLSSDEEIELTADLAGERFSISTVLENATLKLDFPPPSELNQELILDLTEGCKVFLEVLKKEHQGQIQDTAQLARLNSDLAMYTNNIPKQITQFLYFILAFLTSIKDSVANFELINAMQRSRNNIVNTAAYSVLMQRLEFELGKKIESYRVSNLSGMDELTSIMSELKFKFSGLRQTLMKRAQDDAATLSVLEG